MKRNIKFLLSLGVSIALALSVFAYIKLRPPKTSWKSQYEFTESFEKPSKAQNTPSQEDSLEERNNKKETFAEPPPSAKITLPNHYYQTFNNCGPATLAMILNYYGSNVEQKELGLKLRPYQNPEGDNDDKSVTLEELAEEAKNRGFAVYLRPNGTTQKVKHLISNDIPVVVKTWLNTDEDIGHFRVITGYNDAESYFWQDDSYQGPNLTFSYQNFREIWQPFNYQYVIIAPKERDGLVRRIFGEELDKNVAWDYSLARAKEEEQKQEGNPYPVFNQSIAYFYLGEYDKSITEFESVEHKLPKRMLWYQREPIEAYIKVQNYDKALSHIEGILSGGNRAYSELYILRGDVYLEQDNVEEAKQQYQLAVKYNKNLKKAHEKLENLAYLDSQ